MKTQKIIPSILIILICFVSLIVGYTSSFSLPVYANGDSPDGVPVGYSPAGLNDQVDAFRSYCKSRNLFVEGSSLDTITDVTTTIYQHLVADAGLDINELQNQIYKKTNDNVGAKWYFTQTGIAAYNRLFAELLQNNDLAVGDSVVNKNIFNGEQFIDDDGNRCLVYEFNTSSLNASSSLTKDKIIKYGTYLKYDADSINSNLSDGIFNAQFNIFGRTYAGNVSSIGQLGNGLGWSKNTASFNGSSTTIISPYDRYWTIWSLNSGVYGGCIVFKINDGRYGIGTFCDGLRSSNTSYDSGYFRFKGVQINTTPLDPETNETSITNQTVYYTTNNQTINNNNYEGDTYITNEGDVITNEGDDITYNPYPDGGGTTTDPNSGAGGSGTDGTINFPDLNFDLPEINWSLGDLSQKFPFSIPFDLISFFTLINAEPEAPRIDADIPLGSWYTWEFVADFSQFENYAAIVRNVEFIGFCVGLIYITIRLVKG